MSFQRQSRRCTLRCIVALYVTFAVARFPRVHADAGENELMVMRARAGGPSVGVFGALIKDFRYVCIELRDTRPRCRTRVAFVRDHFHDRRAPLGREGLF